MAPRPGAISASFTNSSVLRELRMSVAPRCGERVGNRLPQASGRAGEKYRPAPKVHTRQPIAVSERMPGNRPRMGSHRRRS